MEDIISILIFLVMVAFSVVPAIIKKFVTPEPAKGARAAGSYKEDDESIDDEENLEEDILQEISGKIPKKSEYFTYETMGGKDTKTSFSAEKEGVENVQMSENEQKNDIQLDFSQQELYKGIIYSEILKKRYN